MRLKWILISTTCLLLFNCSFPQKLLKNREIDIEQHAANPVVTPMVDTPHPTSELPPERNTQLTSVTHWFYYLDSELSESIIQKITASSYDMVVIDPIITERDNEDFPIAEIVTSWQSAEHPKLVIAYIDIAEAEDWRTYWQSDWSVGNPDWIIAQDPDGWEGDYPVAYWQEHWQRIWLGNNGYLESILEAGFDGIYLDWVEAYADENVVRAASSQDIDPRQAMMNWVGNLANTARMRRSDFIVIAQNAAELVVDENYLQYIDAIAQEQTWFDGGADNQPAGDCPLPRTDAQVDTDEYEASLSPACREYYRDNPEGTLHISSQEYLQYLSLTRSKGKMVFTVDYAQKPENIAWVYRTSRSNGFVPFVGESSLSTYIEPVP